MRDFRTVGLRGPQSGVAALHAAVVTKITGVLLHAADGKPPPPAVVAGARHSRASLTCVDAHDVWDQHVKQPRKQETERTTTCRHVRPHKPSSFCLALSNWVCKPGGGRGEMGRRVICRLEVTMRTGAIVLSTAALLVAAAGFDSVRGENSPTEGALSTPIGKIVNSTGAVIVEHTSAVVVQANIS